MASFIVYGDASGQVTVAAPSVAGSNTITFPAETGTLITSAYTGTALPGQIAWNTTVQTTGFTAAAYGGYFCNTTSAAFTVTLPLSPTRGQFVVIVDYAGTAATNNITVSPNGGKINGSTSNESISTNRSGITFTYIDSTQGWLSTSNVYGGNPPFNPPAYTASYLVVAGGGGASAGGGGAGGYLTGTLTLNGGTVYTAVVGSGGPVATIGVASTFPGVTSTVGGGRGGGGITPSAGTGGSGGGGGYGPTPGGAGTPGQGNAGGPGGPQSGTYSSGGGGGAGAVGTYNGGAGTASSITGTPATYAGGGGGGADSGSGSGGAGGGGNGVSSGTGNNGTVNTGGGGGGSNNSPSIAGQGGSGVVILSVPTANYSGTTTGSPTITTSGANTIIKWTTAGSGTYTA